MSQIHDSIFRESDIQFYKSGHKSGNCLGGAIHVDRVGSTMHSLFNMVSSVERELGKTKYRCIYLMNRNPILSCLNPKLYIAENTENSGTELYFGWDKQAGIGDGMSTGIAQQLPDESTAPSGVVFSNGDEPELGDPLGFDIPPGMVIPIWLRLVITAGTEQDDKDGAFLNIETGNERGAVGTPANPVETDIVVIGETDQSQHYTDMINRVKQRAIDWFSSTGNVTNGTDPSAWINMLGVLKDKTSIAFGRLDNLNAQMKNKITTALTPANPTVINGFSFKVLRNVYMIYIDCTKPFANPSPQYDFIVQHLKLARLKAGIDFIVVFSNKAFYAVASANRPTEKVDDTLRRTYHQLFIDYGVHVVISAQFRNYQRHHVLGYNSAAPSSPTKYFADQAPNYIISTGQRFFGAGTGCLFIISGTGGQRPLDTFADAAGFNAFKHRLTTENGAGYLMLKSQMKRPLANPKLTGTYYEYYKPSTGSSSKTEVMVDTWSIEAQTLQQSQQQQQTQQ